MSTRKTDTATLRARLNAATAALNALEASWGLWADSVRQDAEARLGVTPRDDLMQDPEYGFALDVGTALDQARTGLATAATRFSDAEQCNRQARISAPR